MKQPKKLEVVMRTTLKTLERKYAAYQISTIKQQTA